MRQVPPTKSFKGKLMVHQAFPASLCCQSRNVSESSCCSSSASRGRTAWNSWGARNTPFCCSSMKIWGELLPWCNSGYPEYKANCTAYKICWIGLNSSDKWIMVEIFLHSWVQYYCPIYGRINSRTQTFIDYWFILKDKAINLNSLTK